MERGVYREIISTATGILAIIGLELQAFSGFLQIRGFVQFVGELVGTWWWAPIHFGLATRRPKWPKIWPICDPCVVYLYLHLAVFWANVGTYPRHGAYGWEQIKSAFAANFWGKKSWRWQQGWCPRAWRTAQRPQLVEESCRVMENS